MATKGEREITQTTAVHGRQEGVETCGVPQRVATKGSEERRGVLQRIMATKGGEERRGRRVATQEDSGHQGG